MALTTIAAVKAFADPQMGAGSDTELTAAVARVDGWLSQVTGRTIEQATLVRYFDGDDLGGRVLYLPSGHYPVLHNEGSDEVGVEEDGSALTVTDGYDTATDVWVSNANATATILAPASLRRNGTWSTGRRNIKVTYKAGYPTVPDWIEWLALELVWLEFKSPGWLGKSNVSQAGESVTWSKDLTPQARRALNSLMAF